MSESRWTRWYKAVLIGDGAVGKTSLKRNYLGDDFMEGHLPTIGVDFAQKAIEYDTGTVKFIIWDLAGQPSFERVRRHYYQGANGIFLVYSVTDRRSFDNATKWLVEAFKYMGALPPTIVIANKIDLRPMEHDYSMVSTEEGIKFADFYRERMEVSTAFRETSALSGEGVLDAFSELINLMSEMGEVNIPERTEVRGTESKI
ncbi:MAG: GTP-binding protein [Candidatus Thorarchaeota archaeon]|jgi:small GTP-binding protein